MNKIALALRHGVLATLVLAAVATGAPAFAQDSPSVCHAIADPTGRLLCYDRVTARPDPVLAAASPGAPAAGTTAGTTAAPGAVTAEAAGATAGAAADVGATPDQTALVTAAPGAETPPSASAPAPRSTRGLPPPPPPPTDALIEPSPIVKLEQTSIGRYRFHLGNGEVWEQLEPGRITLRQGDTVNVRQTTFGAWQMRAADGASRSVRVKRLQ